MFKKLVQKLFKKLKDLKVGDAALDKKVDDQIIRISNILEQWLNWSIKPNEFLEL